MSFIKRITYISPISSSQRTQTQCCLFPRPTVFLISPPLVKSKKVP